MSDILLSIKKLTKHYSVRKGEIKKALNDVSFDIKEGEIFGLLGVNGAGKTTLSSILSTRHPPTSGNIYHDGVSIYDKLFSYRKLVGFCPQKPNLDKSLTLEETLVFGGRCFGLSKKESEKRKDELVEDFTLGEYVNSHVHELSGGYKQRFLIARSIIHSPKFVILDEPTVGLDPHIRHQLWEFIRKLRTKGISVLLTTHYLDEAEVLSDRVCFISRGEIKVIDTPENLMASYDQNNLEKVFLKFVDDSEAEVFSKRDHGEVTHV